MKEQNLDLMLSKYNEINPEEMYEIEGGKIFKIVLIGAAIAFVIGAVNGCASTRNRA